MDINTQLNRLGWRSIKMIVVLSCAAMVSGCITAALIAERNNNAFVATVEGVRVRIDGDAYQSTGCGSAFRNVGTQVRQERVKDKGVWYCGLVRFTPVPDTYSERLRLTRLALNKNPRLSLQSVSSSQIIRATNSYRKNVGRGVLRPAQLLVPIFGRSS